MLKRASNGNNGRMVKVTRSARRSTRPAAGAKRPVKNRAAVALGKLGGKKGGLARAKNLTSKQRIAIAKKAAKARWSKNAKSRKNLSHRARAV
jgi:hypothetical protein